MAHLSPRTLAEVGWKSMNQLTGHFAAGVSVAPQEWTEVILCEEYREKTRKEELRRKPFA